MSFQIIIGIVQRGHQLGRKLGFPTANITPTELSGVKLGIWAVRIELLDTVYWGVANIGFRPSVNNTTTPILEVFIFDFSADIYGETIKIELIKHIRSEKKFSSLELLKDAIADDVVKAKIYLYDYESC